MTERFQFATTTDRDRYVADLDAKHVAERQAYELANMSPDIKPEHYAQCVTQRMVAPVGDLECTTPPAYLPKEDLSAPDGATRISVTVATDGRETKEPITDDPRDAVLVEAEEVKR